MSWTHPATYVEVGAALLLVTLAASLRPAVAASRAEPSVVLRDD